MSSVRLTQNEEFHKLITEHATDMISKHDTDGVFLFASPASVKIVGYTPQELIGRNVYDFFHSEDIEKINKSHKTILKNSDISTISYRFKHKHGGIVWVEATSKTIRDPKTNKVIEIIATTRDISERKKVERALSKRIALERVISSISTKFIRLGLEEVDTGIEQALSEIGKHLGVDRAYIFLYHSDGNFMDNTHEWCAPGIDPQIDNLKNIAVFEELPWLSGLMQRREVFSVTDLSELPPEAEKEREHFEAQSIQSLIVLPMTIEDRLIGLIGFDAVSRSQCWSYDDRGVLRLCGEIFSNAIARKRMDEALRKSDERWQFALEGAGDGVWDWDAATNEVYYSRSLKATLGYSDDDIGHHPDDLRNLIHPDDMPSVMADIERHFSGETEMYYNEHRVLCKDGSYKWILDRGKVIARSEDGKPARLIGTHSDISTRKKAEAEREKLISELQDAMKKVKTLSGLLPICSFCKKIRDDKGYWRQIELYIREHSEAEFSHSLCDECLKKHYPEYSQDHHKKEE